MAVQFSRFILMTKLILSIVALILALHLTIIYKNSKSN